MPADLDERLRAHAHRLDLAITPITRDDVRNRVASHPLPRHHGRSRTAAVAVTLAGAGAVAFTVAVVADDGPTRVTTNEPTAATTATTPSPSYHPTLGYQVTIPSGWHRATEPIMPWLVSPRELLAVATSPLAPVDAPGNQSVCPSEIAKAGVDAVGADGVYVWLGEWVPSAEPFGTLTSARPEHFADAKWEPFCELPGLTTRGYTFSDQNLDFTVQLVFTADTPPERISEAYGLLDSLEFASVVGDL
jgi:hypothetical protein